MSMVAFYILVGLVMIICSYWLWFYLAFNKIKVTTTEKSASGPAVSVIVCYKNAGEHIGQTIQAILSQDYPEFEVLAINDHSHDDGPELLKKIQDDRLILLDALKDLPGKKHALAEAIAKAKHEILLFTDSDCLPASDQWISTMADTMTKSAHTEIVLGYGPMIAERGIIRAFASYETILTAMQYITYALSDVPYMGVGRNLMYKKSLFLKTGGFQHHHHIASGDDDLFIHDAAKSANTAVCLDPNSFVFSASKSSVIPFLQQKSRHISTSVHYHLKHQILLFLFATSPVCFYALLILAWTFSIISVNTVLMLLSVKFAFQMLSQHKIFSLLGGQNLRWWFPLLDISMSIYYIILPIYGIVKKKGW